MGSSRKRRTTIFHNMITSNVEESYVQYSTPRGDIEYMHVDVLNLYYYIKIWYNMKIMYKEVTYNHSTLVLYHLLVFGCATWNNFSKRPPLPRPPLPPPHGVAFLCPSLLPIYLSKTTLCSDFQRLDSTNPLLT